MKKTVFNPRHDFQNALSGYNGSNYDVLALNFLSEAKSMNFCFIATPDTLVLKSITLFFNNFI